MALYNSRKGMSPLIATVLLIAFAVALGAMIMNWSAGIDEEGHGEDDSGAAAAEVCGNVNLISDGGVCYADNKISFDVKNVGGHRIDAVKIAISSDSTEYGIKIKDSALIEDESTSREVPYAHTGGEVEVEFIPMVLVEGDLHECPEAGFSKALSEC
ncbi:MAG: archaellin/type IV pilin N-terminal domain-containing protein [Nanobdellota archaeon]